MSNKLENIEDLSNIFKKSCKISKNESKNNSSNEESDSDSSNEESDSDSSNEESDNESPSQDIMGIFCKKILFKLTILTSKKLNKKQKELHGIKWSDGEANLDMEYSTLACNCFIQSWKKFKKNKILKNIKIKCYPPDILVFLYLITSMKLSTG